MVGTNSYPFSRARLVSMVVVVGSGGRAAMARPKNSGTTDLNIILMCNLECQDVLKYCL